MCVCVLVSLSDDLISEFQNDTTMQHNQGPEHKAR